MSNENKKVVEMTPEVYAAMQAQIKELQDKLNAKNAPKVRKERNLTFRITEKGAISCYGLNKYPVTLYGAHWNKLANIDFNALKAFMEANATKLSHRKEQGDILKPTQAVVKGRDIVEISFDVVTGQVVEQEAQEPETSPAVDGSEALEA